MKRQSQSRRPLLFALMLAILTPLTFAVGDPNAQGSAMKRGRDWLDLREYDNARREFNQAIMDEPKNVEARYLIALSYFQQGYPLDAIKWARETLKISSSHAKANELLGSIRKGAIELLQRDDATGVDLGLGVIEALPSREALPALKRAIRLRPLKAEELIRSIDPKELRATWTALLQDPSIPVQEYAADRLWSTERFPGAAPVLRRKHAALLLSLKGDVFGNVPEEAVGKLVELGWPEAAPILVDAIKRHHQAGSLRNPYGMERSFRRILLEFGRRKDGLVVEPLEMILKEKFAGKCCEPDAGSGLKYGDFARTLGDVGSVSSVPLIKEGLSNVLTRSPNDSASIKGFLDALTVLTKEDWTTFQYWYAQGGSGEFARVGIRASINGVDHVIDRTHPNFRKVESWWLSRQPGVPGMARTRSMGEFHVRVLSRNEVVLDVGEGQGRTFRPTNTLVLKSSPDGWMIDDVLRMKLDIRPRVASIAHYFVDYEKQKEQRGRKLEVATGQYQETWGGDPNYGDFVFGVWTSTKSGYSLADTRLCLEMNILRIQRSDSVIQRMWGVGFTIELENAVFANGSSKRDILVRKIRIQHERAIVEDTLADCVQIQPRGPDLTQTGPATQPPATSPVSQLQPSSGRPPEATASVPKRHEQSRSLADVLGKIRREEQARIGRYPATTQRWISERTRMGREAMSKQDWKRARFEFNGIVEKYDHENLEAHVNLSGIYAMLNEPSNAKRHFDIATRKAPDYAIPYVNMVYAYARTGDVEGALTYLDRAIELGYQDVEKLRNDTDLPKDLREHPRVLKLGAKGG